MGRRKEKESTEASYRYSSHAEQHFETDQAFGHNTTNKGQSGNAASTIRLLQRKEERSAFQLLLNKGYLMVRSDGFGVGSFIQSLG
jgi:hypothetical protein